MQRPWNPWEMIDPFNHYREENRATLDKRAEAIDTDAWEITLLESIWYGYEEVKGVERLKERAFGLYAQKHPEQAQKAVERCLEKGWIQVITTAYLAQLRSQLEAEGYQVVGELVASGLSDVESEGIFTFTTEGRRSYRYDWSGSNDDLYYASEPEGNHVFRVYGLSITACHEVFAWIRSDHECRQAKIPAIEILQEAVPIARWSSGLHLRFESGYMLRIRYEDDGV